jgi:hypothetical protein
MDVQSKKCDSCGQIEHAPATDLWYAVAVQFDGLVMTGRLSAVAGYLRQRLSSGDVRVLDVCGLGCASRLMQVQLQREEVKTVMPSAVPSGPRLVKLESNDEVARVG